MAAGARPAGAKTRITDEQWSLYFAHVAAGNSMMASAKAASISWSAVMRNKNNPTPMFKRVRDAYKADLQTAPLEKGKLKQAPKRALNDFAYFRLRYLGRYSTPWQLDAANQVVKLLESPDKEYVVINVPPGAGKSTLFTHDIPCWLIARNRAIRIMIGSSTERMAKTYSARIKRTLERVDPVRNQSELVEAGLAADAEESMSSDFGRFKPEGRSDLWRSDEFVVQQASAAAIDEKEPTVSSYGRDGGFLGGRFDFVIWDDLVTAKNLRTEDSREGMREWWDSEAETRLEPGGLLVLQGQRLSADDLYRYCLDLRVGDDEDDDETEVRRKYKHVVYRAHYEDLCKGDHEKTAAPYDPTKTKSGCLLDPRRLSYRELMTKKRNSMEKFLVVYQQEDTDPATVLVPKLWIAGGRDPETGVEYTSAWDESRRCGEIPAGLSRPFQVYVTADPSPSKYWSVQMWLYHPGTKQRFLVDHFRGKMGANDFLDFDVNTAVYRGLLESWWLRMRDAGAPFKTVIVEQNAAQKFLLQYDSVKKWQSLRQVKIIGHDTYKNKSDPQFGVQMLRPLYEHSRVRLPGYREDGSRARAQFLVDEVTRWPEASTEDCVMAQWFGEFNLRLIDRADRNEHPRFSRPSWVKGVGRR